jgi:hypothetical protein
LIKVVSHSLAEHVQDFRRSHPGEFPVHENAAAKAEIVPVEFDFP